MVFSGADLSEKQNLVPFRSYTVCSHMQPKHATALLNSLCSSYHSRLVSLYVSVKVTPQNEAQFWVDICSTHDISKSTCSCSVWTKRCKYEIR